MHCMTMSVYALRMFRNIIVLIKLCVFMSYTQFAFIGQASQFPVVFQW
jgi:hypothetical protein